ncbi:fibronectin type III domain-containing protein [Blautia schinkii]|nr:fibronectin type III domain-containing protein [Blautia schinkii]
MKKRKKLLLALTLVAALFIQSFSFVQAASKPTVPKMTYVTQTGSNKLTVSWNYQGYNYGYQLWRSTSKNGKYTRIKTLQRGESCYTNKGLKNGTVYYYKVRAFFKDSAGNRTYSKFSNIKSNRPAANSEGKSKLGTYRYKYNPPYTGGYYWVTISAYSKTSVTFEVGYIGRNGSPLYVTKPVTAKLNGNTCRFTWEDSWANKGNGTLVLKSKAVTITMKPTHLSSWNRSTLARDNFTIKWTNGNTMLSNAFA